MKNALIIGGGSIALRHAKVLAAEGLEVAFVSKRTNLPFKAFESIEEALASEQFDYVVIANETSKHEQTLSQLVGVSAQILVEKPFAISAQLASKFDSSQLRVAFNLRFHPALLWLQKQIAQEKVLTVECYVGQDLATWRPDRPVVEQYSAHKSQGGGVLRDLSHELDYLVWLFGDFKSIAAIGGRVADITVDSDDAWSIVGTSKQARQISLQMNYLDKTPRRQITVNTSGNTYSVDLVNFEVAIAGEKFKLEGSGAETYVAMHKAIIAGNTSELCTAQEAEATDRLIANIEHAAAEHVWLDL